MSNPRKNRIILHTIVILFMLIISSMFYYLGDFINLFGWSSIYSEFLYTVHDFHRLLFLIPVVYGSYIFRVKGAIIISLACFIVFIPRAILLSPFPDPLLRAAVFSFFAGAIGLLIGIVRNEVEKRKTLQVSAKNERDMFYKMLESMPDGVLILTPDYRINFFNTAISNDFGSGVVGNHCYEYLHKFDCPCGEICKLPVVIAGNTARWEYVYPDGRTYEIVASPLYESSGQVSCLAIIRNITKRKQLELELIQLNELKTDLLSNVSHELKSPLTSIKGIISSLLQKDVSWDEDTTQMLLNGISEETDRLSSLVSNILTMSKLESGVWQPELEPRHISDILNDAIEHQRWIYKDYMYKAHIYADLPETMIDRNQIMQVLNNLLENAAAYSTVGGQIIVNARRVDSEIQVSISDNGIGIYPEDVDRIFDKFYRGNQSRERPGGIGLGLSICQSIISAHGGKIWVESTLGKGSTFYFTLPIILQD